MNNTDIRSQYGLKYNPFLPDVPAEAIFTIPGTEPFIMRVQAMAAQGGFALITGDPGLGKSKTLQSIAHRLEQIPDLTVGVMQRPQSALSDFYRELGGTVQCGLIPRQSLWWFQSLANTVEKPLPVHIAPPGTAHRRGPAGLYRVSDRAAIAAKPSLRLAKTCSLRSYVATVGCPNGSEPPTYCLWEAVSEHGLCFHLYLPSNCRTTWTLHSNEPGIRN